MGSLERTALRRSLGRRGFRVRPGGGGAPPAGPVSVLGFVRAANTANTTAVAATIGDGWNGAGNVLLVGVTYQNGGAGAAVADSLAALSFTELYRDSNTRGTTWWAAPLDSASGRTITCTLPASTRGAVLLMGLSNALIPAASAGNTSLTTTFSTTHTFSGTSLTTAVDGQLLVAGHFVESNYSSAPQADNGWSGAGGVGGFAWKAMPTAGNPGNLRITSSANGASRLAAIRVRSTLEA